MELRFVGTEPLVRNNKFSKGIGNINASGLLRLTENRDSAENICKKLLHMVRWT
jgi:hypothetical protein